MILAATAGNAVPMSLSCTGTAERKILLPATYPETMEITVDITNSTLTLDDEPLPIASASGNIVTVNSSSSLGHKVWIFLNRVTGAVLVAAFNDRGQIAWEFEAVCRPETTVEEPKAPPGALGDVLRE
jgi:hypothetical protein